MNTQSIIEHVASTLTRVLIRQLRDNDIYSYLSALLNTEGVRLWGVFIAYGVNPSSLAFFKSRSASFDLPSSS